MQSVRQIAARIVAREGGYVNDPDDPGGPTNFGVTLATMRRLGLDLNGDSAIDTQDLQRLQPDRAADIFLRRYFDEPGLKKLPEMIQPPVFDMYVNAGSNAVRILQKLLNDMGLLLVVDGKIGPQTIRTAHRAAILAPRHLADAYGIARRNYYYRLGDRRPASRKFARRRDGGKGGWIVRAEAFISPRFRLSDGEHRQRVASWG